MAIKIIISLIADSVADARYAMDHALDKFVEGDEKGDLTTEGIKLGNYIGETVCSFCYGTGFIEVDGNDGEGHTARGVDREKCKCGIFK